MALTPEDLEIERAALMDDDGLVRCATVPEIVYAFVTGLAWGLPSGGAFVWAVGPLVERWFPMLDLTFFPLGSIGAAALVIALWIVGTKLDPRPPHAVRLRFFEPARRDRQKLELVAFLVAIVTLLGLSAVFRV